MCVVNFGMGPVLYEALFDVWWEWCSVYGLADEVEFGFSPLKVGVRAKGGR